LLALPETAVRLFGERLRPVPIADQAAVTRLIADLGIDQAETRDRAEQRLAELDMQVLPALQKLLERKPPDDVHRRVDRVLDQITAAHEGRLTSGGVVRGLRIVGLLELIDTTDARQQLKALAGGEPKAHLTVAAQRVLDCFTEVQAQVEDGEARELTAD